jgi:acylphosphatase
VSEADERAHEQLYCVVTGRVQGVGFRAFVQNEARLLGLTGWVRNGDDGRTVEMVVEGDGEAIRRFVRLVGQGPPAANVTNLRKSTLVGQGNFTDFVVRP